jgi:hypothetical protein
MIAKRPARSSSVGWHCGFYPSSHRGDHVEGTAVDFDQARAQFEAAWEVYLPMCTEADFQKYRDQCDWTARKYAMWARGEKLPLPDDGLKIVARGADKEDKAAA